MRKLIGTIFIALGLAVLAATAGALADNTAKNVGAVYLCNFLAVDAKNCATITNGAVNISGTINATTTFPYSSNGANQSGTGASAISVTAWDGAHVQPILSDTSGRLQVVFPSAQAVSQSGAPWSDNVAQINGVTTAVGTGASNTGTQRVVLSSDSIPAFQAMNVAQVNGVTVLTGTGASGTGTQRVSVANDSNILATESGTWTVQPGNTANTTPWLTTDDAPILARIISSSATACTNLSSTVRHLVTIVNIGAATTVFPQFYDDAGTTCATTTNIYGDGTSVVLGAGQILTFKMRLSNGLAYKLSSALTSPQQILVNAY